MTMWYNKYGVSPIAAEVEQIAVIRKFCMSLDVQGG